MSLAYGAPWSLRVKALTVIGTIVLLGDAGMLWFMARFVRGAPALISVVPLGLLAILAGCALLAARGYGFETGTLLVQRLVWTTRVSLEGLRSVVQDPRAIGLLTIKAFGNGGLFAILGWRYVNRTGGVASSPRTRREPLCSMQERSHHRDARSPRRIRSGGEAMARPTLG